MVVVVSCLINFEKKFQVRSDRKLGPVGCANRNRTAGDHLVTVGSVLFRQRILTTLFRPSLAYYWVERTEKSELNPFPII